MSEANLDIVIRARDDASKVLGRMGADIKRMALGFVGVAGAVAGLRLGIAGVALGVEVARARQAALTGDIEAGLEAQLKVNRAMGDMAAQVPLIGWALRSAFQALDGSEQIEKDIEALKEMKAAAKDAAATVVSMRQQVARGEAAQIGPGASAAQGVSELQAGRQAEIAKRREELKIAKESNGLAKAHSDLIYAGFRVMESEASAGHADLALRQKQLAEAEANYKRIVAEIVTPAEVALAGILADDAKLTAQENAKLAADRKKINAEAMRSTLAVIERERAERKAAHDAQMADDRLSAATRIALERKFRQTEIEIEAARVQDAATKAQAARNKESDAAAAQRKKEDDAAQKSADLKRQIRDGEIGLIQTIMQAQGHSDEARLLAIHARYKALREEGKLSRESIGEAERAEIGAERKRQRDAQKQAEEARRQAARRKTDDEIGLMQTILEAQGKADQAREIGIRNRYQKMREEGRLSKDLIDAAERAELSKKSGRTGGASRVSQGQEVRFATRLLAENDNPTWANNLNQGVAETNKLLNIVANRVGINVTQARLS